MRRLVSGALAALIVGAAHVPVHAQAADAGPDPEFRELIDDDLQTQAQEEAGHGRGASALALLNELVERDPRQAGAMLEAAVLYCQLGERDLSLQTLARIEKSYAVPPAIEKLIVFYRASPCTPSSTRLKLVASAGLGTTSNANFGPSDAHVSFAPGAPFESLDLAPASLAHGDQFLESAIQAELPVPLPGVTLLGALTDRRYQSLRDYDQRIATFGVAHHLAVRGGELDQQITADVMWLGSRTYQHDIGWHAGYWAAPVAWSAAVARFGFDVSVSDAAYPGNGLYDSLHTEVRLGMNAHIGERTTILLFAGPVWDKPQHDRPGGMRRGYGAWFALDYDMARYGQLEAILQQRTLTDAESYDPVFFGDVTRQQKLLAASLRYVYSLNRNWSLYGQVSTQRITDSISLFSYSVRSGSVGVSWKY